VNPTRLTEPSWPVSGGAELSLGHVSRRVGHHERDCRDGRSGAAGAALLDTSAFAGARRASRASEYGRVLVVRSERQRGLSSDARSAARAGAMRLPPLWRRPGKWRGLNGSPAFLFRRGSARFAMSRVSRLSPRSREHFRAGATGRDALRGTRKPSACRLSVRPGAVPVRRPGRGSGYGPVPAGRWALTPRATRNSAATSRVAASAPSGNT
jgi:hypothetical protein